MAEEVLQGVVSSICTRNIIVNAPGVTRFLEDEACKSIMKAMETKFQVYIIIKQVPWEPLPHQVISWWNKVSFVFSWIHRWSWSHDMQLHWSALSLNWPVILVVISMSVCKPISSCAWGSVCQRAQGRSETLTFTVFLNKSFHFPLLSSLTADLLSFSTQHIWNKIYIEKRDREVYFRLTGWMKAILCYILSLLLFFPV